MTRNSVIIHSTQYDYKICSRMGTGGSGWGPHSVCPHAARWTHTIDVQTQLHTFSTFEHVLNVT